MSIILNGITYLPSADGKIYGKYPAGDAPLPVVAFPGAQGYGTDTRGGAGGTTYIVSNLNDSGAGSFREAVEASGARVVVFNVSGTINLLSEINITSPNLTILGQTSPGGIQITGNRFKINTNDVIIRYIRSRLGSHGGVDPESARSIDILGNGSGKPNPCYNIVVDHCSLSWAADQVANIGEDAYDVTLSNNIIGEGLNNAGHPESNHSYALLYWGKYTQSGRRYSFHHNYIPNCLGRIPEINFYGHLDAVNNVAYNYEGGKSPAAGGETTVNWIHNYTRPGPNSNAPNIHYEVRHKTGGTVAPKIYVNGNVGVRRNQDQSDPVQWYVGDNWTSTLLPETWRALSPVVPSLVTHSTMDDAYALVVVNNAGANFPSRDTADQRMVDDWVNGTARVVDDVAYPADFPVMPQPSAPTDTNSDGIPDGYETHKGFSIGTMNPTDTAPSGYTWIEEYANDLVDGSYTN